MSTCAQEMCENWSGDGRVCPCVLLDLEGDERPIYVGSCVDDPCDYCSHDNNEHAEDGCRLCGCAVPQ